MKNNITIDLGSDEKLFDVLNKHISDLNSKPHFKSEIIAKVNEMSPEQYRIQLIEDTKFFDRLIHRLEKVNPELVDDVLKRSKKRLAQGGGMIKGTYLGKSRIISLFNGESPDPLFIYKHGDIKNREHAIYYLSYGIIVDCTIDEKTKLSVYAFNIQKEKKYLERLLCSVEENTISYDEEFESNLDVVGLSKDKFNHILRTLIDVAVKKASVVDCEEPIFWETPTEK